MDRHFNALLDLNEDTEKWQQD